MDKNFCPFANGSCRSDCKFYINKTATTYGIRDCIIFVGLASINDCQSDQLAEISQCLESISKR